MTRSVRYGVYLICLLYLGNEKKLSAQSTLTRPKFLRIEVGAGLSNSNITCILQDSRGFLWVGTEDGLNKYDGYDFKVYRKVAEDTTGLLRNSIATLFEDSQGKLWISTRGGGLYHYNRRLDKFARIDSFSYNCDIVEMVEDADKNLWIAGTRKTHAFVGMLDRRINEWRYFNLFPSHEAVCAIIPESKTEFWIGVRRNGFYKWNAADNSLESFLPDKNNPHSIISTDIMTGARGDGGVVWIGTRNGLSRFDTRTKRFTNFTSDDGGEHSLVVNTLRDLSKDGDYIWVATENGGLSRLDTRTNRFVNFLFDKDDPSSLSDNSVWSVYKDPQGRIWVGTFSRGLCVIDNMKEKFSDLDIPLQNDIVNAIWKDKKNRIWIGTEGGLVRKDENGAVHYYKHDRNDKGSLSSDPVLSIFEDSRQRMWFGTWAGGVNRYDDRNDRFIHYMPSAGDPSSLSDPNVYSVTEWSQTKQILVCTYKGLNILTDEKKRMFEHYRDEQSESNNYLRTIYEDSKGNVWTGSIDELNLIDVAARRRTRFPYSDPSVEAFVNCLLEDSKGRLWMGTGNGLYLIVDKQFVAHYTIKNGLPNNIINGILEDNSGNLWLSTTQGLSMFNPRTRRFKNFDVNDGLLGNEFKPNAYFKSDDGRFFFGGTGVSVFYPDSIKANPYVPSVFITDLKVFNRAVKIGGGDQILKEHISETEKIRLHHRFNFFTIQYVALNFTASHKNQYAYKLEGFDKDWNYVGSQRTATFTNLDAGTYVFRVKASNNDGLWNEQGTALTIQILPPWWETWWFRSFGFLMLSGMAVAFYKVRVRTIQRRSKKLESLVDARTDELLRANEELIAHEEEIRTQNDELHAAREVIEEQNRQIKLRNETLEAEVTRRTKELVEYNQQLEQFAFISAHNLRAPVARILGLGRVLELADDDPEEARRIFEKLIFTAQELDRVVKDLISILEVRKNNTSYIDDIDVGEEMDMVKKNLAREITEIPVEITEDFSKVHTIQTVRPYFDSILMNLVSNAIKYRHPARRPSIRIRTDMVDGQVCLSVADNGLGIDLPRFRSKLFKLYNRFHLHVEGKGMGLYLVKTQVTTLGGKIEVESEVDRGTTFKVYFKAEQEHHGLN